MIKFNPDGNIEFWFPGPDDAGPHPIQSFLKWNEQTLEFEYWIVESEGERMALTFSDFALRMIIAQHQRGENTGRIEVITGTHGGHLKLLSIPLSRLCGFVKEEYDVDIGSVQNEELIKLTRMLEEHPEDWDGPCECATCLSYGDG